MSNAVEIKMVDLRSDTSTITITKKNNYKDLI